MYYKYKTIIVYSYNGLAYTVTFRVLTRKII